MRTIEAEAPLFWMTDSRGAIDLVRDIVNQGTFSQYASTSKVDPNQEFLDLDGNRITISSPSFDNEVVVTSTPGSAPIVSDALEKFGELDNPA